MMHTTSVRVILAQMLLGDVVHASHEPGSEHYPSNRENIKRTFFQLRL